MSADLTSTARLRQPVVAWVIERLVYAGVCSLSWEVVDRDVSFPAGVMPHQTPLNGMKLRLQDCPHSVDATKALLDWAGELACDPAIIATYLRGVEQAAVFIRAYCLDVRPSPVPAESPHVELGRRLDEVPVARWSRVTAMERFADIDTRLRVMGVEGEGIAGKVVSLAEMIYLPPFDPPDREPYRLARAEYFHAASQRR